MARANTIQHLRHCPFPRGSRTSVSVPLFRRRAQQHARSCATLLPHWYQVYIYIYDFLLHMPKPRGSRKSGSVPLIGERAFQQHAVAALLYYTGIRHT